MKIVCESCGAKYSIADDRVAGKMFKIRCKKCSEVIVVRGDQQAAPESGSVPAQTQAAIWHVVVDGEQAGPYTPAQLAEMLTNGSVDWEAYVWTEGFDNWAPMRDVPDLVAQITGQPAQQAAAAPASAYRATHETLQGQPSMGADPFADDGAADSGLFGGQAPASDLFARGPAPLGNSASALRGGAPSGVNAFAAEEAAMAAASGPRVSAENLMTGARNENSVLFSLKNLQALATGSASTSMPAAAAAPVAERGGFAGGEGSGLIDIRALANATGVGSDGAAPPKDELLSMGSQGGAFGGLASPMLAPVAEESVSNKKTLVWAMVAALGLVSAAAVAVVYILRAPSGQQAGTVGVDPIPTAAAAAAAGAVVPARAAPQVQAATQPPQPSEGELAAKEAAAARHDEHERDSSKSRTSSTEHRRRHEASSSHSGSSAAAEPEPAPKKEAAPAKSGPRTLDQLLDGALNGSSTPHAKSAASEAPASNLKDTPTRDEVLSAMNGVKSAVQACAKGEGGVATVTVNVAGSSGRVTTAQVQGVTGPAGSCIAKAVRKADFPKFKQNVFRITFPYKL